ncbi:MAG: hypothetical protein CR967_00025 [Proteobacteria bacterium]|nr:MAG: hypothetical protein CR967_00025 [Pseudomonadota bacterium]
MKFILKTFLLLFIAFAFQGCIVGTAVSFPIKITGKVLNVVTPDVVGDTVSFTGEVVDAAIPF